MDTKWVMTKINKITWFKAR